MENAMVGSTSASGKIYVNKIHRVFSFVFFSATIKFSNQIKISLSTYLQVGYPHSIIMGTGRDSRESYGSLFLK